MSQLKILDINSIDPEDIIPSAENVVLQTLFSIHCNKQDNEEFEKAQDVIYGLKDTIITINPETFNFHDYYFENHIDKDIPEINKLDGLSLVDEEIVLMAQYDIKDYIKGNKLHLTDFLCYVANDRFNSLIDEYDREIERDERRLVRLIKEGCIVPADDDGLISNQKKKEVHNILENTSKAIRNLPDGILATIPKGTNEFNWIDSEEFKKLCPDLWNCNDNGFKFLSSDAETATFLSDEDYYTDNKDGTITLDISRWLKGPVLEYNDTRKDYDL